MTNDETQLKQKMQELINELDKRLIKFAFQAKLNGLANSWIYHQMKTHIDQYPEPLNGMLIDWLDSRWGEYKLYG